MMSHPYDRIERKPLTCIWEITRACNLSCIHCENRCGAKDERELSLYHLLKVADGLARLGCRTAEITGGEPLLRTGWDRLCGELRKLGMNVALITNGTLLSDDALGLALDAGVGVIAVSLDGLQAMHDATRRRPGDGPSPWQDTVAGLQRALKAVTTKVITQVNCRNLPELPQLRRFLRELGVQHWQLQLAVPTGRLLDFQEPYVIAPRDLEVLTRFIVDAAADGMPPHIDVSDTIGYYTDRELILRERTTGQGLWIGCQAGLRIVAITYSGTVRGCSALPSDFDAGDLHHESLETIWKDPMRFAYSTRFDPTKLTGSCADCRLGEICRAGCRTMAYWTTGTIYHNPYCLLSVRAQTQKESVGNREAPCST